MRWVASDFTFVGLIYSDIVDEHRGGPGEVVEIDSLEIVRHAEIDDLKHEHERQRGRVRVQYNGE